MTQTSKDNADRDAVRVYPCWISFLSASLILFLAILFAYLPAFPGSFLWDDDSALLENPLIHQPNGLIRTWFSTEPLEYYPIFYTSLRAQWHFFGPNPTGYLIVNLILHTLNAILLMLVLIQLRQTFEVRYSEPATASETQVSGFRFQVSEFLLPALFFALHPVNVFSVAWINQHKTVLSTLFYLLSILFFCRAYTPAPSPHLPRRWLFGPLNTSLIFFIAGLLTKPTMVLLPIFFALLVHLSLSPAPIAACPAKLSFLERSGNKRWRFLPLFPFFIVALLAGLLRIFWQPPLDHALAPPRIGPGLEQLVLPGQTILFYLSRLLIPIRFMMVYPRWSLHTQSILSYLPTVLVFLTCSFAWCLRKKLPFLLAGFVFFLLGLFPILGFFDNQYFAFSFVANHWLYMPMMGIAAILAAFINRLKSACPRLTTLLALLIPMLLLIQARIEASRFHDPTHYYERGVRENPDSIIGQNNLANLYLEAGESDRALPHYLEAIRIHPVFWHARIQAGKVLVEQNRTEEAIEQFLSALEIFPDNPEAHFHLGTLHGRAGNLAAALQHLEAAVVLNPYDPVAFNNLGSIYFQAGYQDHAIACFEKALELNPAYESARNNLEWARQEIIP